MNVYRVSTEDCAEGYETLLRPDDSEVCCLTEPEDRNFGRDLEGVVKELNQLYEENQQLKGRLRHERHDTKVQEGRPCTDHAGSRG